MKQPKKSKTDKKFGRSIHIQLPFGIDQEVRDAARKDMRSVRSLITIMFVDAWEKKKVKTDE